MEIKDVHLQTMKKVKGYNFYIGVIAFKIRDMDFSLDISNEGGDWNVPKQMRLLHEADGYCPFCEKNVYILVDKCQKQAPDMWKQLMNDPKIRLRLLFKLNEKR